MINFRKSTKPLAGILTALLVFQSSISPSIAAWNTGEEQETCPLHSQLEHQCDQDCSWQVRDCKHDHTDSCYATDEDIPPVASSSQTPQREPNNCQHQCGEDNGCIEERQSCSLCKASPSNGNPKARAGSQKMIGVSYVGGTDADYPATGQGLQDAFNCAMDGETIMLGADFTFNGTTILVEGDRELTLDFNGHTISYTGADHTISILNDCELTLQDSLEKGGIESVGNSILFMQGGSVTMKGGSLTSRRQNGTDNSPSVVCISESYYDSDPDSEKSTYFHMSGGSLTVTAKDTNVILDTGARSASIVIDGGTIQAKGSSYSHGISLISAKLEINGGEIAALNSNSHAVVSQNATPITITGGTLTGNSTAIYADNPYAPITVSGGNVMGIIGTVKDEFDVLMEPILFQGFASRTLVTEVLFEITQSPYGIEDMKTDKSGNVTVWISIDDDSNVSVTAGGQKKTERVSTNQVKIGEKFYRTLASAVDQAKDGDILILQDKQFPTAPVIIQNKKITLDLNGYFIDFNVPSLPSPTGYYRAAIELESSAKLTVINSKNMGGSISALHNHTISLGEDSTLLLQNATLSNQEQIAVILTGKDASVIQEGGSILSKNNHALYIEEGSYRLDQWGAIASQGEVATIGTGDLNSNRSINIQSGSVNGKHSAIHVTAGTTLELYDESYIQNNSALPTIVTAGTTNIHGGSVTNTEGNALECLDGNLNIFNGTLAGGTSALLIQGRPFITVTGGTIRGAKIKDPLAQLQNDKGQALQMVTISGLPADTQVNTLELDPAYDYGSDSMYTDSDGSIYLWVPKDSVKTAVVTARDHTIHYTLPAGAAQIGDKVYASLQDAFDAAKQDDTVKVLENLSLRTAIYIDDKSIILDLNGHRIDLYDSLKVGRPKDGILYDPNAGLIIRDSSDAKTGMLSGNADSIPTIDFIGAQTLRLESGTITTTGVNANAIEVNLGGEIGESRFPGNRIEIAGGTIQAINRSNAIQLNQICDVQMDGGSILTETSAIAWSHQRSDRNPRLVMNGGQMINTTSISVLQQHAPVDNTLLGGSITGKGHALSMAGGSCTIDGTKLYSLSDTPIYTVGNSTIDMKSGTVTSPQMEGVLNDGLLTVIVDGGNLGSLKNATKANSILSNTNAQGEPLNQYLFTGLPENAEVTEFSSDPAYSYSTHFTFTNEKGSLSFWLPQTLETASVQMKVNGTLYKGTVKDYKAALTPSGNSSGGSGSGGSGSGGSSSGSAGTSTGWMSLPPSYTGETKKVNNITVPAYVIEGTWRQENGYWLFTDTQQKTYQNCWAPVFNPYANQFAGQYAFDWFFFDENGRMITGWYTDAQGNTFYLNPVSDNTLGAMKTGWVQIDGEYYYFNDLPDGTRGRLLTNTTTPDGYRVDEKGIWHPEQNPS